MKNKATYTLDKYYVFERQKGYKAMNHFSTEDEIKELCAKNRIVIKEIIPFDGYRVIGTKTRSHKECKELQEVINKQND